MSISSGWDRNGLDELANRLDRLLAVTDAALVVNYPGKRGVRQPVHTVYVPADRYSAETVAVWGKEAISALDRHAGSARELATVLDLAPDLAEQVYQRVKDKLSTEPIEDLRIDFEDGFGVRQDEAEDAAVDAAAAVLAATIAADAAAPFYGIRIKSFEAPTRRRALRTLDRFVRQMAVVDAATDRFVITLPKVTTIDQVAAMAEACATLETAYGLRPGALRFEIQVETPQAILGSEGTARVTGMIKAAAGRCTGLHYGTYDYSAALGVAATYQSLEHPVADHAKSVMQVAAAETGVFVSDGSTNVLPVGGTDSVHNAWRSHHRLVRRSLERGIYQGWDMHPAQLPSRYTATYAFFREDLGASVNRLRTYLSGGDSRYLDEPATAAALAGFVLRGVECGAVAEDETGTDLAALADLARRRTS